MPLPVSWKKLAPMSQRSATPTNQLPLTTTTTTTALSAPTEAMTREKTKLFHEKLSILNENFLRYVQRAVKDVPAGDFVRY